MKSPRATVQRSGVRACLECGSQSYRVHSPRGAAEGLQGEKASFFLNTRSNGFQGTELTHVIGSFLVPEHGVLGLLRLVFRKTNFSSVGSVVKAAATMDASH